MKGITEKDRQWVENLWNRVEAKVSRTSERIGDTFPYISYNGKYEEMPGDTVYWWTNGFWPGIMWHMYRETKNERYRQIAEACETKLDEALYGYEHLHHDVGFMWTQSSVASYKLTENKKSWKRAMIAASILASRYNIKGKYIRAWNQDKAGWAIVDCLLNLPILYWASEQSKDNRFANVAIEHATTAMNSILRSDGSVNHIVNFDPETGEVIETIGGQGYEQGSSWSRGQSWALYGFALSYKYTGKKEFLDAAKRVAHYFIASIYEDFIPNCDFRQPEEPYKKDSSAGAIAACGLILIAKSVGELEAGLYLKAAKNILKALDEKCGVWDSEEEALFRMGTQAYHHPTQHEGLIYGDYYFIEALAMLKGETELS